MAIYRQYQAVGPLPSAPIASEFAYTGKEELDAMEAMHKYNRMIASIFCAAAREHGVPLDGQVVDFGAGIGTISSAYEELSGHKPIAIEIDHDQAQILRQRGFEVRHSFQELTDPVDLCFSSNVLEHIEDDVTALRRIHASLRRG